MTTHITYTFCGKAENHVGMEQVKGATVTTASYDLNDLKCAAKVAKKRWKCKVQLHHLNRAMEKDTEDAYVLVIKRAVPKMMGSISSAESLFESVNNLFWDNKYYCTRRRKVLNKHARQNNIVADFSQKADYANKKGTIHSFEDVPLLSKIREEIGKLGSKFENLIAEGNKYLSDKKNGIGYHGDAERTRVVGVRLSSHFGTPSMPLYYRWYHKYKPCSDRIKLDIDVGDIYIMSKKAVGTDWKRSSIVTLRHATGAVKYTK